MKGFGSPSKLAALHAAIEKWEGIAKGERADGGTHDCPLCALYLRHSCVGCPVFETTGKPGCDAAPYEIDWAPLVTADGVKTADTPEKVAAARKIVAHLRELVSIYEKT